MRVAIAVKRGFVIAASNWPLSLILFGGQLIFQAAIAVPVMIALIGLAVGAGRAWPDFRGRDLRDLLALVAGYLGGHLGALMFFALVLGTALLFGSMLMFFLKGGVVGTTLGAHRAAGGVASDVRWHAESFRRFQTFSRDRFLGFARHYFVRYLILGLGLSVLYVLSGGSYLLLLYWAFPAATEHSAGAAIGWTFVAFGASLAFVAWITCLNLFYLLAQIVMAVDQVGVLAGLAGAAMFLLRHLGRVAVAFGILLLIVVCTTLLFILATALLAGLALIPLVGLLMIPLQLLNLILRGLVFQFLGVAALATYVSLYDHAWAPELAHSSAPVPVPKPSLKHA